MLCLPDDPCYTFQGQLNSMSDTMVRVESITTDFQVPQPEFVKRTKIEAGLRASEALKAFNRGQKVPFLRPYVFALNLLTYGLIIIDPLDRLE